jgi:UDP-N-acetylmuramoyl-L-alanyl-D-glutamate--2,6-diaminopimelate ligase
MGTYNVQNAMAAGAAALALGLELEEVAHGLSHAPQVPGRLEQIVEIPCRVIIDFAHSPDALRRVLETVRAVTQGRVIVVFGAGGDRDVGKRPLMGEAVAQGADLAVVTSDNPRTEDPESIIRGILRGMTSGPADVAWEVDRREAIRIALARAQPDDVVLLAGKGHETYQVVGTNAVPFDEREVVREILESGRVAG